MNDLCLQEVCDSNLSTYLNLAQAYEAEFSPITKKNPNLTGLYELDTTIGGEVKAYILQNSANAIGFAAASVPEEGTRDLREFYIVPTMRGKKLHGSSIRCYTLSTELHRESIQCSRHPATAFRQSLPSSSP